MREVVNLTNVNIGNVVTAKVLEQMSLYQMLVGQSLYLQTYHFPFLLLTSKTLSKRTKNAKSTCFQVFVEIIFATTWLALHCS
jgi:hypothetical protein